MDDLNETLAQVAQRIRKYHALYEQNEIAVREQIVNPILKALEWNTEAPDEVQPNAFTDEGGLKGYFLIKDSKKTAFVDVKKLNIDVENKESIRRLAKFSSTEGIKLNILTNGSVWVLIRLVDVGNMLLERKVWQTDLECDDLSSVARKLSTIAKRNMDTIDAAIKRLQLLNEIWQSLFYEPERVTQELKASLRHTVAQEYGTYRIEDAELDDLLRNKIKDITITLQSDDEISADTSLEATQKREGGARKMRLDRELIDIRIPADILTLTANWLIRKGKLTASDCPILVGHKKALINKEPKHRYGEAFSAPKKLSNELWIDTNYSVIGCTTFARQLLKRFGYPPEILSFE